MTLERGVGSSGRSILPFSSDPWVMERAGMFTWARTKKKRWENREAKQGGIFAGGRRLCYKLCRRERAARKKKTEESRSREALPPGKG